ncbi:MULTISPECIES: hypothetical protein [Sphingomonas]|uniref:hypothetical protein n=1 Tax=Sphingomonas TaxID=13687 RepID=UPI00126A6431|nr:MULTISPECIES: hypothetical protein [Sphingomonas]
MQLTEHLVTSDAVFVMGDFGGPYAHLLKALKTERGFLPSCHLTSLRQMGMVDLPLPAGLPPEVHMLAGHFTEVGGDYDCLRTDGGKASFKVDLLLRDNLVAKFSFGFPR